LFARRTAPREAAQFVARQLLMMPDPLRSGLAAAHSMVSFTEITGRGDRDWLEICDTAAAGRLPLVMLGPLNSGLAWPSGDVTVSLGSVGLFRRGCGLDLPIAVAILTAAGTLPADPATGAPVRRRTRPGRPPAPGARDRARPDGRGGARRACHRHHRPAEHARSRDAARRNHSSR